MPRLRRHRSVFPATPTSKFSEQEPSAEVWHAPAVFSLLPHARSRLLSALASLRKRIGIERKDVTLDFRATAKMHAEGTLLFLAELKRLLRHVKGEVEIGCILPHNNKVAQVLKQVGVLDLLGVTTAIVPVDSDVVNWKAAHGTQVLGEKYDDILQQYDGAIADLLQTKLYTGITEAMTNVINHAYDFERDDGLSVEPMKEWWMFSQQQHGFLTIVFCDLGAGIPRTLPRKRPTVWQKIRQLGRLDDAAIIRHAVKDSVSRTLKDYRGKGLGQIVRVVSGIPRASVSILSNRGVHTVMCGKTPHSQTYSDNILGTLIYWRIPLPAKEAA